MKLWAIRTDGKFAKIGETIDTKDWYEITAEVSKFMSFLKRGDEVDIAFEVNKGTGNKVLTFIGKKKIENKTIENESLNLHESDRKIVPDRDEMIKRMSVMRAVGDAMGVFTGQVADVNAVIGIMETLYDRLYKKLSA